MKSVLFTVVSSSLSFRSSSREAGPHGPTQSEEISSPSRALPSNSVISGLSDLATTSTEYLVKLELQIIFLKNKTVLDITWS